MAGQREQELKEAISLADKLSRENVELAGRLRDAEHISIERQEKI